MGLSVSVPEELYYKALALANAQRVSVDEIFVSAFAQQISALERGSREQSLAVLDRVPDVDPEEHDRWVDWQVCVVGSDSTSHANPQPRPFAILNSWALPTREPRNPNTWAAPQNAF